MGRLIFAAILTPMLAIAVAGCSGQRTIGGAPGLQVVSSNVLPTPDPTDQTASNRPYYVGSFDKLMIDVFGIDPLSKKEVQVDASGRISFPLIGTVEAGGKTPEAIAHEIESRLRGRFVRNPQVTVNLQETVSQVITIEGEVKQPGLYPVIGKMTLIKAVATAKGTTDLSSLDDVVVFRTVNNQKYAALYNLRAIRNGAYDDPEVYANDVVMVGRSHGRQLFEDFLLLLPTLTTPLVLALQKN